MEDEFRLLLLDLELTFAVYYAYPSRKEQYLSADNIKHDQFCPCANWKWYGKSTVHGAKITDDPKRFKKNFRDDYVVAKALHEAMQQADIIIAHNGDKFDIKHANVIFKRHNLGPIPPTKSIDTLKVARKYFNFPGNSLDQLAKRFGFAGKNKKPNWKKMTEGDAKEINIAARYCKNDVLELEKIFEELRPYITNYPAHKKNGSPVTVCPKCGSCHSQKRGVFLNQSGKKRRYQCQGCGSYFSGEKV